MPGVLIIESIAQAGGALLLTEIPDRDTKLMVFTGIDRAKFRRPVVPGDQLRIEIDVINWKPRYVKMQGRCTVEGKLACEAIVTCQLVPRQKPSESTPAAAEEPAVEEATLEPVTHE
jgi:3-hydroxyacyl-[acyl-carrier-protein] dehydratase